MSTTVAGLLEINDKGIGFLRSEQRKYKPVPADPTVPAEVITNNHLKAGLQVTAVADPRLGLYHLLMWKQTRP